MNKFKIEGKWGLVFVVMSLVWMALERLVGLHSTHIDKHAIYTNLFAIPAIAVYVFALLDKRKHDYQGTMTYGQGFMTGVGITVVVTILSPLTGYLTVAAISPDFFPNAIAHAVESGNMTRADAESYFTVGSYLVQGLIGTPVLGLITAAVVAFFTKRKPVDEPLETPPETAGAV